MTGQVSKRGHTAEDYLTRAVHRGVPIDLDNPPGRGGITLEPWMVDVLRKREAEIRRFRKEIQRRLAGEQAHRCAGPECTQALAGRPDRRYCSNTCRQAAHRARHKRNA